MEFGSHFEWYTKGEFAPYVRDHRLSASVPAAMLEIGQPPGDYPDPPVPDLLIIQDKSGMRAHCNFGAGRFRFAPGSLTIVPCMSATDITVDDPHLFRTLAISPARLNAWFDNGLQAEGPPELGRLHATGFQNVLVDQLLDRLWSIAEWGACQSTLLIDAALLTLWGELLREVQQPLPLFSRGGLAPWQVRRCTEYLNDHLSENVGLEHLAALAGLSPFHFARAFKQSTGVPPHRYQLALRIAHAKALLEATDAPVTQIAFDVGYESSQALARLFRREVGLSPSEYRRQRRI
jgi:AraC family transcriptional regulator